MKYTLNDKEIELSKMPGFYIVELRDKKTCKVIAYSIEDFFEAENKFRELKRKLIKETKYGINQ